MEGSRRLLAPINGEVDVYLGGEEDEFEHLGILPKGKKALTGV